MPESKCGTWAGYQAHRVAGEEACEACMVASRENTARRREKRRLQSVDTIQAAVAALPERAIDDLGDCIENLELVRTAMAASPLNYISALSKQRAALVARIVELDGEVTTSVDALEDARENLQVVVASMRAAEGDEAFQFISALSKQRMALTQVIAALEKPKAEGGVRDKIAANRSGREERRRARAENRAAGA